jgi:transcriptional regulator with XRE-family HTH domain
LTEPARAELQAVGGEIDVGTRLREIRQRRGLVLREVADRAQISESFLSQVERGRAGASIVSLQRIAAALGLSIAELFETGPPQSRVVRRQDLPSLVLGTLGKKFNLTPDRFKNFEVFVGEMPPGGTTGEEQYVHGQSEELLVVLAGEVMLQLGDDKHRLQAGDSIDYFSSTPHRLVNCGQRWAEVIWIVSPPSY